MVIVVIGGQSHNIGKTSVACALIAALPERRWTAIKITLYDRDPASESQAQSDLADPAPLISEETNPSAATDSSRYLAAGAIRSLWLRTHRNQLSAALPQIQTEIARSHNVLFESNSILRFLNPDFYATVLNPEVADFKPSALQYLDRADALLLPTDSRASPALPHALDRLIARIPTFRIAPPDYASADFAAFVSQTLDKAAKRPTREASPADR